MSTTQRHSLPWLWLLSIAIPLAIATIHGCFIWHDVLIARGYGYVMNAGRLHAPFSLARLILFCLVLLAAPTYPFVRPKLPSFLRWLFVITIEFALSLFIVQDFLVNYGPEPWWHH